MLRSVVASVSVIAIAGVACAEGVSWRTPTHARPGQEVKGVVEGLPDAKVGGLTPLPPTEIRTLRITGDVEVFEFSLTIPEDTKDEALRIMLDDGKRVIETHEIPIVQPQEFDITGDAAIELVYDVKGLNGRAVFVPCCTIYSGMLTAFTLDVNPVGNGTGLPEHIEKPFTVMEPDRLAATTSGLALELNYGDPPAEGLVPAVMSYNKHISQWEPIDDAKHDEENKNLLIQCPNGGQFVIGWLPEPTP